MKEYRLFANVHPLEPDKLICIDTINSPDATFDLEKWIWIQDRRKDLNALGYKTEIHEVSVNIYK